MNRETITKILEAIYDGAEDVGAGDEAAVAIFNFAAMLTHFKLGDEARQYIERTVLCLAAGIDRRKDKSAQS